MKLLFPFCLFSAPLTKQQQQLICHYCKLASISLTFNLTAVNTHTHTHIHVLLGCYVLTRPFTLTQSSPTNSVTLKPSLDSQTGRCSCVDKLKCPHIVSRRSVFGTRCVTSTGTHTHKAWIGVLLGPGSCRNDFRLPILSISVEPLGWKANTIVSGFYYRFSDDRLAPFWSVYPLQITIVLN